MVTFWNAIPDAHISWILDQKLFWVATAPLNPDGHVNVSPKGVVGTFHVVNPNRVWYEDLSGSGVETISHIRENKRITVMFIAFEGTPRILRLFGRGTVYEFGTAEYCKYITPEKRNPGSRAVIMIDIYSVGSSCGFSVPYFSYVSERTKLSRMAAQKEAEDKVAETHSQDPTATKAEKGLRHYWQFKNRQGLDGLPGLQKAPNSSFTLTGYGALDTTDYADRVAVKQTAVKVKPVQLFGFGDTKLFMLLIGFIAGSLAASLYHKLLA